MPIQVVHQGQGFALNDDEFHVLKIHIVRVRRLQPRDMRELLEANKTLEEIRAEITEKEWTPFYRGNLRLGKNNYKLANITVSGDGANRTFTADIVDPLSDSSEALGQIIVTTMN